MNSSKTIILAISLGVLVSILGEFIMGYLSAIAIPKAYFEWSTEVFFKDSGLLFLYIIQQFIGFGILGILAGAILGKVSPTKWFIASVTCYTSVLLYFTISMSIVLGVLSAPIIISSAPWWLIISLSVLPLCIIISAYIVAHRYIGIIRA